MTFPSDEVIREWKDEYGNVYSSSIRGVDYIFRLLTYHEYDSSQKMDSEAEAEEYIAKCVLLHPQDIDFDNEPAGVFSSLAVEVLTLSGFARAAQAQEFLDEGRERVAEVWGVMKSFVLATMPAYKEEELDHLTFKDMAYKVALSEKIIGVNQSAFGVENEISMTITDPEAEAEEEKRQAQKHAVSRKPGQASYDDPIAQKLQESMGG